MSLHRPDTMNVILGAACDDDPKPVDNLGARIKKMRRMTTTELPSNRQDLTVFASSDGA